jgi:hypothetical protein
MTFPELLEAVNLVRDSPQTIPFLSIGFFYQEIFIKAACWDVGMIDRMPSSHGWNGRARLYHGSFGSVVAVETQDLESS